MQDALLGLLGHPKSAVLGNNDGLKRPSYESSQRLIKPVTDCPFSIFSVSFGQCPLVACPAPQSDNERDLVIVLNSEAIVAKPKETKEDEKTSA